ncbi:ATPase involved in DNA repair [Photobacterium proteolyticum]|uniref:ATPase involved in DNA repair n=1 Tax=Photobacterium proteolyticum TaxID=1903952 RepID=A0A1Q9GG99_9GAMM|nr:ATPase involved in DNA repair [Photobacterium proteolyticum]OLQ73416.1 ATPase involved in DNA repair [Photobacterium proteolyticum]
MKQFGKAACIICLAALLSACQSTPEGGEGVSSQIHTENLFQGALKAHQIWLKKLEGTEQLKVYSPDKYALMMSSWEKADSIFQEFKDSPEMASKSYSLFSSSTYLDRFYEEVIVLEQTLKELEHLKRVADDVLEPAITQLDYLNSIDARQYYRSEYVRLTRFYAKLFRLVENSELSDAKEEQEEFLERAHSLEIRTIKKIYISPQEDALRKLRREDVKYYAPVSYARVEAEILKSKELIERAPRAFDDIKRIVSEIQFELAHAKHIALEVKALRDRSKDEYENFILDIETKLLQISMALNGSDLRDQSLKKQAEQIKGEVTNASQLYAASQKAGGVQKDDEQLAALTALVTAQQKQIKQLKARLMGNPDSLPAANAEQLAAGTGSLELNTSTEDVPERLKSGRTVSQ